MFAERVEVLRFMTQNDGSATCKELEQGCGFATRTCIRAIHALKQNGTVRRLRGIGPWARWMLTVPLDPFVPPGARPLQL